MLTGYLSLGRHMAVTGRIRDIAQRFDSILARQEAVAVPFSFTFFPLSLSSIRPLLETK